MTLAGIENAYWEIKSFVHKTPLVYSNSFSRMFDAEVYLKCENLQKTGSFKVRGSFNKIIKSRAGKVIAASMGNHAQGVAYASKALGVEAKIIMPQTVSIVKEEATRSYGADVLLLGETLSESLEYAASRKDYLFVHPFDDYDVMAGQGTIAIEIAEELKDIDAVIVPVGGGGLIAGISTVVKSLFPGAEVIGVQAEAATSALLSFEAKSDTPLEKPAITGLADGIAVSRVGEKPLEIILKNVDSFSSVSDELIARAILLLMERKKLVVEGAGAVPLALLLKEPERFRGRRVVLVISGGNIDFSLVDRIVRQGLVANGRVGLFCLVIDDTPGSLNRITRIIAANRANILSIHHDRLAEGLRFGKTKVHFAVETRGREHLEQILGEIEKEAASPC